MLDYWWANTHVECVSGDQSIRTGVLTSGRLDKALADALPDLSRERLKALLLEGHLTLNGRKATKPSEKIEAPTPFELTIPALRQTGTSAQDIALNIVCEDEHLLVIDKPAGLVVHPSPGHEDGTLVNALLHHCKGQLSGIGGEERPGIVHRIDALTSGLLVVAKSDAAHQGLSAQFAEHSIERLYKAIVKGVPTPPQGTVSTTIGRAPNDRKKMAVLGPYDPTRAMTPYLKGKHAITHYKILQSGHDCALIQCQLETGRTHQVRVHMAHIGHPLIGDPLYGRRRKLKQMGPIESEFQRQALHAATLGFIHPLSGEKMRFESPIPADMQELLSELIVIAS